ncbi:MAG: response regulator [Ottowia sp.]
MRIQNVLVIDDSRTELIHLSQILETAGYQVAMAENSEQAWQQMQQNKPDLILMDVVMPGVNGFRLTRMFLRDPRFADVPIVICSGKGQPTDRIWGMRQGARGYLVKPVTREDLLGQIAALEP